MKSDETILSLASPHAHAGTPIRPSGVNVATSSAFYRFAAGCLMLLLAFWGFWRFRAQYLAFVNNSDLLYLLAFYRDLTSHQYSMSGWRLTPAPYFFPDMPVFFAAAAITRCIASTYSLYGGAMLCAIFGGFYFIARRAVKSAANVMAMVGLAALVVFVLCLTPDSSYWMWWKWILAPSGHGGGMVAGLFAVLLGMRLMHRVSATGLGLFFALCTVTIASDALVLPHFLLPIVATAICFAALRRIAALKAVILAAAVGLAKLSAIRLLFLVGKWGLVVPEVFMPDKATRHVGWAALRRDLHFFSPCHPTTILLAVSVVTAAVVLYALRTTFADRQEEIDRRFKFNFELLVSISLMSVIAAAALPVATGLWANIDNVRYLQPLVVFPLLVLIASGGWAISQLSRRVGVVLISAAGAGLIAFWIPVLRLAKVDNSTSFDRPEIDLVDNAVKKHHLHVGSCSYWPSKFISLNSHAGVLLNQLDIYHHVAEPTYWINNPHHWFDAPRSAGGGIPRHDFVVCTAVERAEYELLLGPPAAVESEGEWSVLVYNRDSDHIIDDLAYQLRLQFRKEASHGATRRVLSPRSLNRPKQGADWNAPGAVIIPVGKEITIALTQGQGDLLEIGADNNDAYELRFQNGGVVVGSCTVGPVAGSGLQPRMVEIHPVTGGKPFDSIIVRPVSGDSCYSVGWIRFYK